MLTPAGADHARHELARRISERELDNRIRDLCRLLGIWRWHAYDSRRSARGFPDLVLVGTRKTIFRELKTERGRLTLDQKLVGNRLKSSGQDCAVWRPSDLLSGRIAGELAEIAGKTLRNPGGIHLISSSKDYSRIE